MKEKVTYKSLRSEEIASYRTKLLDLYDPERKRARRYMGSIRHADSVFVAESDGIVVGSVRAISDGYMCAMIIDLLVRPEYRGRGIGSELIRRIVRSYQRKWVKNIELVADPRDSTLVPFYCDLGFEYSPNNWVYMVLKKT